MMSMFKVNKILNKFFIIGEIDSEEQIDFYQDILEKKMDMISDVIKGMTENTMLENLSIKGYVSRLEQFEADFEF